MDVLVERCAGLDVHRDDVVATVRVPGSGRRRWEQQTRTFRATLAGLLALSEWLSEFGVTLVGMEATGVYWKTVFQALEDRFECWLLNAHHLCNVPGRKTDVKDSEWICQLVQHGLVRPSFVPPPEIRRLRDLTRLRKAQTNERARSIQRLEKVLQDAGIKLTSVASHTYSKSARAMLEALLSGVSDPDQLAELAKSRMRAKIPQLREALQSRFKVEHHGLMVAQLLAHIDTLDGAIQNLSERIEFVLTRHAPIIELLCTIPGVQLHAAQVLIAECGLDMTLFPTVGHLGVGIRSAGAARVAHQRGDLALTGWRGPVVDQPERVRRQPRREPLVGVAQAALRVVQPPHNLDVALEQRRQPGGQLTCSRRNGELISQARGDHRATPCSPVSSATNATSAARTSMLSGRSAGPAPRSVASSGSDTLPKGPPSHT